MNKIRIATRAVIEKDGKLLFARYSDAIYSDFYVCVGGGQNVGENMTENIKRECLEETGCEVEVGEFMFMREVAFTDAKTYEQIHQIEHYFSCKIKDGQAVRVGSEPDNGFVGFEWLSLDELKKVMVFPSELAELIRDGRKYICEM